MLPQLAILNEYHASSLGQHRCNDLVGRIIQHVWRRMVGYWIFQTALLAEPRRHVIAVFDDENIDASHLGLMPDLSQC